MEPVTRIVIPAGRFGDHRVRSLQRFGDDVIGSPWPATSSLVTAAAICRPPWSR
jgi:hypothetical protein